ncbi:hypothetical protein ACHAXA_009064 [Cyclostephanos tholiformis]|uniref:Thioredoxin domain-containing protein n=1 Tax=Cyclostephanos tholiformis TaxID=382380 RepID=A0ABD3RC63_9STRA
MRSFPITLLLLSSSCLFFGAAVTVVVGRPHSNVVKLTKENFDDYVTKDDANGIWFLKFYAPWCGHCKTLAPVLESVAPFLAGKMAIGKIDCTIEKELCKTHGVRGYPTLKYYRDGEYHDYPSGRDADSIIAFGEKMSDRAVSIVSTYHEATRKLLTKSHPVAFVVYDPGNDDPSVDEVIDASGSSDEDKAAEKMIRKTERTRAFGEVARNMQARASFGLLDPIETTVEEVRKFFVHDDNGGDDSGVVSSTTHYSGGGFVARIEEGVPIRIFDAELSIASISDFVTEYNLATVLELSGQNFRFVSRRGKALGIAAYNPDDDELTTERIQRELRRYAISGPHRDDYIFAKMDGKKWDKFLGQFQVRRENLPEFFVVDVPSRTYWQDSSVSGISNFISGVKDGTIVAREQEKSKSGPLDDLMQAFVNYMPWSLGVAFVLFVAVFVLALRLGGDVYGPSAPAVRQPKTTATMSVKWDDELFNKKDR